MAHYKWVPDLVEQFVTSDPGSTVLKASGRDAWSQGGITSHTFTTDVVPVLRVTLAATTTAKSLIGFWVPTSTSGFQEVLFKYKVSNTGANVGVLLRKTGTAESGYYINARSNTYFQLTKETPGLSTMVQQSSFVKAANTIYWVRARIEIDPATGRNRIKARIWSNSVSEPTDWRIDYTDPVDDYLHTPGNQTDFGLYVKSFSTVTSKTATIYYTAFASAGETALFQEDEIPDYKLLTTEGVTAAASLGGSIDLQPVSVGAHRYWALTIGYDFDNHKLYTTQNLNLLELYDDVGNWLTGSMCRGTFDSNNTAIVEGPINEIADGNVSTFRQLNYNRGTSGKYAGNPAIIFIDAGVAKEVKKLKFLGGSYCQILELWYTDDTGQGSKNWRRAGVFLRGSISFDDPETDFNQRHNYKEGDVYVFELPFRKRMPTTPAFYSLFLPDSSSTNYLNKCYYYYPYVYYGTAFPPSGRVGAVDNDTSIISAIFDADAKVFRSTGDVYLEVSLTNTAIDYYRVYFVSRDNTDGNLPDIGTVYYDAYLGRLYYGSGLYHTVPTSVSGDGIGILISASGGVWFTKNGVPLYTDGGSDPVTRTNPPITLPIALMDSWLTIRVDSSRSSTGNTTFFLKGHRSSQLYNLLSYEAEDLYENLPPIAYLSGTVDAEAVVSGTTVPNVTLVSSLATASAVVEGTFTAFENPAGRKYKYWALYLSKLADVKLTPETDPIKYIELTQLKLFYDGVDVTGNSLVKAYNAAPSGLLFGPVFSGGTSYYLKLFNDDTDASAWSLADTGNSSRTLATSFVKFFNDGSFSAAYGTDIDNGYFPQNSPLIYHGDVTDLATQNPDWGTFNLGLSTNYPSGAVDVSENNKLIAIATSSTGSTKPFIKVFDTNGFVRDTALDTPANFFNFGFSCVKFTRDSKYLLLLDYDGAFRVLEVGTWSVLSTHYRGDINTYAEFAISRDQKIIALPSDTSPYIQWYSLETLLQDNTLSLWPVQPSAFFISSKTGACAFSPNNKQFAVAINEASNRLQVSDVQTGATFSLGFTPYEVTAGVGGIKYSSDSKYLYLHSQADGGLNKFQVINSVSLTQVAEITDADRHYSTAFDVYHKANPASELFDGSNLTAYRTYDRPAGPAVRREASNSHVIYFEFEEGQRIDAVELFYHSPNKGTYSHTIDGYTVVDYPHVPHLVELYGTNNPPGDELNRVWEQQLSIGHADFGSVVDVSPYYKIVKSRPFQTQELRFSGFHTQIAYFEQGYPASAPPSITGDYRCIYSSTGLGYPLYISESLPIFNGRKTYFQFNFENNYAVTPVIIVGVASTTDYRNFLLDYYSYKNDGTVRETSGTTATGVTATPADALGIAVDEAGRVWFLKNGVEIEGTVGSIGTESFTLPSGWEGNCVPYVVLDFGTKGDADPFPLVHGSFIASNTTNETFYPDGYQDLLEGQPVVIGQIHLDLLKETTAIISTLGLNFQKITYSTGTLSLNLQTTVEIPNAAIYLDLKKTTGATSSAVVIPDAVCPEGLYLNLLKSVQTTKYYSVTAAADGIPISNASAHVASAKLFICGQEVSEALVEGLTVELEEGTSALLTASIKAASGVKVEVHKWFKRPVDLFVLLRRANEADWTTWHVFRGVTREASFDYRSSVISLRATDALAEAFDHYSEDDEQSVLDALGATYNAHILGESDLVKERLQSSLDTIAGSVDMDLQGTLVATSWMSKANPDFTYDGDVISDAGEISVNISMSSEVVNTVEVTFQNRYERLFHRRIDLGWHAPFSFDEWITTKNHQLPTPSIILSSLTSSDWLLDSVYFIPLPPTHDYGGAYPAYWVNPTYPKTPPDGLVYGFGATAAKQWAQTVTETFTIKVKNTSAADKYGEIKQEESYSVVYEYPVEEHEGVAGNNLTMNTGNTQASSENYFYDSDTNRFGVGGVAAVPDGFVLNATGDYEKKEMELADVSSAYETAIKVANNRIVSSHRGNSVGFMAPMQPWLTTRHTVKIEADRLTAKGKVRKLTHNFAYQEGSAEFSTNIELALIIAGDEPSTASSPSYPGVQATPGELESTGVEKGITLNTYLGNSPEKYFGFASTQSITVEDMTGFLGNYFNGPPGGEFLPYTMAIKWPEIEEVLREPYEPDPVEVVYEAGIVSDEFDLEAW